MTTQTEALKHEIHLVLTDPDTNLSHGARRALDYVFGQLEALAQPEQEPVAFYRCNGCGHEYQQMHPISCDCMKGSSFEQVNYYTTPPQRTWVGLTEQEQGAIMEDLNAYGTNLYQFARAIEAKLKEKNSA